MKKKTIGKNSGADELNRLEAANERAWGLSYTPSETLSIAGITADMLATWHKRRQLPAYDFPECAPGHGNRRKYFLPQIIVLAVARLLIDGGLPVDIAMSIASFGPESGFDAVDPNPIYCGHPSHHISKRVFEYLSAYLFRGSDASEKASSLRNELFPVFAVYRFRHKFDRMAGNIVKNQYVVSKTNAELGPEWSVLAWMRESGLDSVLLVDTVLVSARILGAISKL